MWILTEKSVDRDLFHGPFETHGEASRYRVSSGLVTSKIEPLIEVEADPRAAEEGAKAVESTLFDKYNSALNRPRPEFKP